MRYRKKPVVIDAMRWGEPRSQWPDWLCAAEKSNAVFPLTDGTLSIATLEGTMIAQPGDMVIRGVKAEIYPCKPDIFAATYDPVPDEMRLDRSPNHRAPE